MLHGRVFPPPQYGILMDVEHFVQMRALRSHVAMSRRIRDAVSRDDGEVSVQYNGYKFALCLGDDPVVILGVVANPDAGATEAEEAAASRELDEWCAMFRSSQFALVKA